MSRDQRVFGTLGIVISLLCCLPIVCFSMFILLAGGYTALQPGYAWTTEDTQTFIVFGVGLAIGLLGLLVFLGGGIWAVRQAQQAEQQEKEYFDTLE